MDEVHGIVENSVKEPPLSGTSVATPDEVSEDLVKSDEAPGNVENAPESEPGTGPSEISSTPVGRTSLDVEESPGNVGNIPKQTADSTAGVILVAGVPKEVGEALKSMHYSKSSSGKISSPVIIEDLKEKPMQNVTKPSQSQSDSSSKTDQSSLSKMATLYPALAIGNFVAVLVQYVFNALSSTGPDGVIFKNKTGDISDIFYTDITPAGWTFSIWGFIYTWQASWVVFSLLNICRKVNGRPAYENPQYLPYALFILNILVSGLNIAWLISFDRQEIEVACASLIAYTLVQYAMLFVVYRALDRSSPKLVEQKRTTDIWLTRGLVLNGIGIQAAWVTIATLLNIQMVLVYSGDKLVGTETAGTIALSILSVIIVVFVGTDLFLLDRYTRYTITPYIVVVVALAGSISKNWDSEKQNSIFSAVLLAVSTLFLVVKVGLTLYKHFTKSRYTTMYDQKFEDETTLEEKSRP